MPRCLQHSTTSDDTSGPDIDRKRTVHHQLPTPSSAAMPTPSPTQGLLEKSACGAFYSSVGPCR